MTDKTNEIEQMFGKDEVPKTVRFNVGGIIHEVSRSLLLKHENSMLAKASSKTWQSNPEMAIFIEGDGERFRYCLDCMRHGRVHLPLAVSKAAVLQDLDYYGIQVSDPSLIDGSCASIEAAEHMATKQNHYSQTVSVYDEQIKKLKSAYEDQIQKLELERSSFVLAFECYKLYCATGVLDNLKFERESVGSYFEKPSQKQILFNEADTVLGNNFDQNLFDNFLAEHGLYYISKNHSGEGYAVTLGKLSEKNSIQS